MFRLFKLRPGLPSRHYLDLLYYLLLVVSIGIGAILIMEGIYDPFGDLYILFGILELLIVPLSLRILFGLLLKEE